jgi:AraC-like DNA-binding protein
MSVKRKTNVFDISAEVAVNLDTAFSYAVGWEYGRNHAMPLWFEFVTRQTWTGGMEYIHDNPINTSFEIPLDGQVDVVVDGLKYTVGKGELLVLPRGVPNKIMGKSGVTCRKLAFGFSGTLLGQLLSTVHLDATRVLRLTDVGGIYNLVERGRVMLEGKREKDVPALSALAIELIMTISQQCSTYKSPLVANAIYFMNFNIARKITLSEIAAELKISQQKLIDIFKAELHVTPRRHLINLRMAKAESLLLNSRLTVNEIAAQTGYSTAARFIREFKKKFCVSPAAYRKCASQCGASAKFA